MSREQDLRVLEEAGIKDINSLVHAAASFLRTHPPYSSKAPTQPLSPQEAAFLRQSGAVGIDDIDTDTDSKSQNVTVLAAEYALMVVSAYSLQEAADYLGCSLNQIHEYR